MSRIYVPTYLHTSTENRGKKGVTLIPPSLIPIYITQHLSSFRRTSFHPTTLILDFPGRIFKNNRGCSSAKTVLFLLLYMKNFTACSLDAFILLCFALLDFALLYSTLLCSTLLCYALLYSAMLCSTLLYFAMLCSILLCSAPLYSAMLYGDGVG